MKALTKKWLDYAKADLEAAEVLATHPKSYWSYQLAVFHCHQAIEKILKTLIIHRGEVPIKTHDLPYLVQKTGINFPEEFLTFISALNGHYQTARYPDIPLRGPAFSYTKRNTAAYITHTKKVFLWLEKKLIQKK